MAESPGEPFRGFAPFDEAAADVFFGRAAETEVLAGRVLGAGGQVVVVTGEAGVGKTSLVRAGLAPALGKRGIPVFYIDGAEPGALARGADATAEAVAGMVREAPRGMVVVLDHLEALVADDAPPGAAPAVGALAAGLADAAPGRARLVLVVDDVSFGRLDRLALPPAFRPAFGSAVTLARLGEAAVAEIVERTAVHSGTPFEPRLGAQLAADLCGEEPCLPIEVQLVGRALVDLVITSVRKYQATGGVTGLRAAFFERAVTAAGGAPARRFLVDVAAGRGRWSTVADVAERARLPPATAAAAGRALADAGLVRKRPAQAATGGAETDEIALAHPALAPFVDAFSIEDRARAEAARRRLQTRLASGRRLSLREIVAVRRTLGGTLGPAEQALVGRSVRWLALQVLVVATLLTAIVVMVAIDSGKGYVLAFDPPAPRAGAAARVVVRAGRPGRGLGRVLPGGGQKGALIADTGFSAAGLADAAARRIAAGDAGGALDVGAAAVPSWLRDVVNGLRPVPRGVAKALIGDPDGVTSLKQAFADPLARRETLDALEVIGRGRAGEDEILAAALADAAPEIRRRGVEVAAAIDRRQGNDAHGGALRNALGDRSSDVRLAVLGEVKTLPGREATDVLGVALRDRDPAFRRRAEETTLALAARQPEAAAEAAALALESPDGGVRRDGLALLEKIAGRAPAASAGVLGRLAARADAPEQARVSALVVLRKAGPPAAELKPMLEQAVAATASPRLRSAALPLYARLIDPVAAEEIARAEMKGPPTARAAGAAVWGAVAATRPDLAKKPLKGLVYDPSVEIRVEAARSFAFLKREGIVLTEKVLKDPNAEVQRAAIESALALAAVNPRAVGEMLGKAVKVSRPAVRRQLAEALGRLGEMRPDAALPPLAHALKDPDSGTRAAVAAALCVLARKSAVAVSPYLRIAARDEARDVRSAAAACAGELAAGDPRGAAKMAAEMAAADEPSVRAAAAESMGRLAARMPELALGTLLRLVTDGDAGVRVAAARGLSAFGDGGGAGAGFAESKRGAESERALVAALGQGGDVAERRLLVGAAAKMGLRAVLRQATADGDEVVRLDAVRAAAAMAPPALDVVREAVDDRAPEVRGEATRILAAASGGGAREVLPIYEAALRGGDHAAREAAAAGLGELGGGGAGGAGEAAARLLGEALGQRSESIRAAAARALGRLAERDPAAALPALERALHDPSYDVASAAVPGLALAWSRRLTPAALGGILAGSEGDSARRFVALEALVLRAQKGPDRPQATSALDKVAESGPPLARLGARLGRAFLDVPAADLHAFLERLLGG